MLFVVRPLELEPELDELPLEDGVLIVGDVTLVGVLL